MLNACYSVVQAEAIAAHIPYVIGMNEAIGDRAATTFALGFYRALGAGEPPEQAFLYGRTQIMLEGLPEGDRPVLFDQKKEQTAQQLQILLAQARQQVSDLDQELTNTKNRDRPQTILDELKEAEERDHSKTEAKRLLRLE